MFFLCVMSPQDIGGVTCCLLFFSVNFKLLYLMRSAYRTSLIWAHHIIPFLLWSVNCYVWILHILPLWILRRSALIYLIFSKTMRIYHHSCEELDTDSLKIPYLIPNESTNKKQHSWILSCVKCKEKGVAMLMT